MPRSTSPGAARRTPETYAPLPPAEPPPPAPHSSTNRSTLAALEDGATISTNEGLGGGGREYHEHEGQKSVGTDDTHTSPMQTDGGAQLWDEHEKYVGVTDGVGETDTVADGVGEAETVTDGVGETDKVAVGVGEIHDAASAEAVNTMPEKTTLSSVESLTTTGVSQAPLTSAMVDGSMIPDTGPNTADADPD